MKVGMGILAAEDQQEDESRAKLTLRVTLMAIKRLRGYKIDQMLRKNNSAHTGKTR